MRIGVITFWQTKSNYGQVLQCFALQKFLKNAGHDTYLIRYGFHHKYYDPLTRFVGGLKGLIVRLLQILPVFNSRFHKNKQERDGKDSSKQVQLENLDRGFDLFRRDFLEQSKRFYNSLNDLQKHPPKADCYITGSDQVWAQLLSKYDNRAFYLDFGNEKVKRLSYAASFAMNTYPTDLKPLLKEQLTRFNEISVREIEGCAICNELGFDAQLVVDPVLLLKEDEYLQLMKNIPREHEEYAYIYSVNIHSASELGWDIAKKYIKSKSLNAVATWSEGRNSSEEILDGANYVYPTVQEWLSYIYHSNFVVTTSFHGIVFCLLFNKNFVYFPLEGRYSQGNNRVTTLLKTVGLQDKIANSKIENFDDYVEKEINWDKVNEKINNMKDRSFKFLRESLR